MTLASGQGGPLTIAIDATSVYWAAFQDQTMMKVDSGKSRAGREEIGAVSR